MIARGQDRPANHLQYHLTHLCGTRFRVKFGKKHDERVRTNYAAEAIKQTTGLSVPQQ